MKENTLFEQAQKMLAECTKKSYFERLKSDLGLSEYTDDEVMTVMNRLCALLADRNKQCFILHYINGLSSFDIAKKLGLKESTIRCYLTNAVRELKQLGIRDEVQTSANQEIIELPNDETWKAKQKLEYPMNIFIDLNIRYMDLDKAQCEKLVKQIEHLVFELIHADKTYHTMYQDWYIEDLDINQIFNKYNINSNYDLDQMEYRIKRIIDEIISRLRMYDFTGIYQTNHEDVLSRPINDAFIGFDLDTICLLRRFWITTVRSLLENILSYDENGNCLFMSHPAISCDVYHDIQEKLLEYGIILPDDHRLICTASAFSARIKQYDKDIDELMQERDSLITDKEMARINIDSIKKKLRGE